MIGIFPSQEFVDAAGFGKVSPASKTWDDDGVVYAAERLAYAFISAVTKSVMGRMKESV